MHKRLGWVGLLGAGVLGLAGCGSSSVSLDSLDEEFVNTVCAQTLNCPDQWRTEFALLINVFDQQGRDASCQDLFDNVPAISRPQRDTAGVEGGTIQYDTQQAQRCVQALVDTCIPFQFAAGLEACQGVFIGLVDSGDSCETTSQCEASDYCLLEEQCSGTCTPRVARGEPCTSGDSCAASPGTLASCETIGLERICVEFTLQHGVAVGQTCGVIDAEGNQRTSAFCAPGLYCRTVGNVSSCAVPVAAGETCTDGDVCERGYFCESGSCRTVAFADSVGDGCNTEAFMFCDGSLGLSCDLDTNRCVAVGDGSLGSPCSAPDDEFLSLFICDDGLFCDGSEDEPTCSRPRTNGSGCVDDIQCESGYCIDEECSPPTLCTVTGPIF